MRLWFLSSTAKNTQTADAAQALKPPVLKGLTEKQSKDPSCPENVEKCPHTNINKFTSHLKLHIINKLIGNYVLTTDKTYLAHYKPILTHFKCTRVCV